MNKQMLSEFYEQRGYDEGTTAKAIEAVIKLENCLAEKNTDLKRASLDQIKVYVEELAGIGASDLDSLIALARYFYLIGRKEIYIYFTQVLGGVGVIDNIRARMVSKAGEEKAEKVFLGLAEPPLGTSAEKRPKFICKLMERMESYFDAHSVQSILAGNNHGLSPQSQAEEKKAFEAAPSLDVYLEQRHARKVKELQEHCDSGKVWFEQIITQEVVDFVAANQEILSAVRDGNLLYVTKIPYDTLKYLAATDEKTKRYYACHCPFVRESILSGERVSPQWCYCSGGFAKFPFEQILGRELTVKMIKSPLAGDDICRFAIDIS